jgi:hypothetical protein
MPRISSINSTKKNFFFACAHAAYARCIYIYLLATHLKDQIKSFLYSMSSVPNRSGTEPNRTEPAPVRFLAGLEPVWQKPNRDRTEPNRIESFRGVHLIKSHKNVTKYLILSLNTRNWTRSFYIKFRECLSKITRLLCDSIFCIVIVHDSQKFLFEMSLIRFILSNILTSRRTFCFFRYSNRAYHTFRMSLLIVILDSFDDIAKLSTINVTMKL